MQKWFLNRSYNTSTINEAYTKNLRRQDILQQKWKEPDEP